LETFQPVDSAERIAEVARLAREIWQEHYVSIIGQNQVDYMLEKFQSEQAVAAQLAQAHEYYLVARDREYAGYLAVVPNATEGTLMLSKIYVRKSQRGHGLGKELLQFVEGLGLKRGLKVLWLTVNKNNAHSIAWYSRLGFRNAGSVIQDIGGGFVMDDFRMEKTLAPQSLSQ
jgi:ribosomal protein S18 acetylase RimI-like enzyme